MYDCSFIILTNLLLYLLFRQLLCEFYPLQNASDKPRVLEDEYTKAIITSHLKSTKEKVAALADIKMGKIRTVPDEHVIGCMMCWEGGGDAGEEEVDTKKFGRTDELMVVVTNR